MSDTTKSRIHYLILINVCALIAWYFWVNVRPQIIYAACSDVAQKSTSVGSRFNLHFDQEIEYSLEKDDCISNAFAP